jgi:archaellum component FlaC
MTAKRLPQKLVTFSDQENEIEKIENELKQGWSIVSLVSNGNNYFCILEKQQSNDNADEATVYIPPRKKIKIHSK